MEITNSGVLSFGNGETASFDTAAYIKKREKTVTGSTVSVSDAAAYPAVGLTVNIEPVQEGSGTPSPDNIRPITGWTGVNVYQSGADTSEYTTIPITFSEEAGTVYGGTLDVLSGVLTVNKKSILLKNMNLRYGNGVFFANAQSAFASGYNQQCEVYTFTAATIGTAGNLTCGVSGYWDSNKRPWFKNTGYTTVTDFVAAFGNYKSVIPINSVTYQLAPTQIEMLLGDNNIWADTGNVSLTYRVGEEWYSADPTLSRSVSPILSMSRTADIENDFELGDISEYDDEFEFKELDEAELKELDEAETEQKTEHNTKKEW